MLDNLDKTLPELDGLSTADIKTIQDQLATAATVLKRRTDTMNALLARRFETAARAQYKQEDKDTGTVRVAAPGSNLLELKVEIDKTVVWDQTGLIGWLNKQKAEDARHYGKLKAEVAEDKYKNAPPAVQTELRAFRSVKAGKPKYTLVPREPKEDAPGVQEAA